MPEVNLNLNLEVKELEEKIKKSERLLILLKEAKLLIKELEAWECELEIKD